MSGWQNLSRDGVGLACRDFGGEGEPALLLHGLAGHAQEWSQMASWLTDRCHVMALDARGHGRSERLPSDVSRDSQADDVSFVIEQLRLSPVILVGQSLGGLIAMSVASRRPDLVRALVLLEASPAVGDEDVESGARELGQALRQWPVPFASREAGRAFFQDRFGTALAAEAWADGLDQREGGWWPWFEVEVMIQTLLEVAAEPGWEEWERIRCPTLVVRAGKGIVQAELAQQMLERLPTARLVELEGAGHDIHLDQPDSWRHALNDFLDSLELEGG